MSLFTKRIKHKGNNYLVAIHPIMIALVFSVLFIGCRDGKSTLSYKAIDKKDTAVLSLNIHDKYFFGDCKISYGGSVINSGKIKGDVKGDTLIGSFRYKLPSSAYYNTVPIALLKKGNSLIMGNGVISSYMNFPIYMKEVPIDYNNPKFIFTPVDHL
ncbi:hypothetical protein [Olivibacter domesticus]|nr:hypothetical protein [Olivibacter domesticus]